MRAFLSSAFKSPWFRQVLKIGLSFALLAYCLTLVDFAVLPDLLRDNDYRLLGVAFCLTLTGTIVSKAVILWLLLSSNNKTPLYKLIEINLTLRFYTMILPKALVAGIRWDKYRRLTNAQVSLVIVSFEVLLALTTATICALIFMLAEPGSIVPIHLKIITCGLLVIFVTATSILFFCPRSQILAKGTEILTKYRATKVFGGLAEKWRESVLSLRLEENSILYPIFLISLIGHLVFLLGGYVLFQAMNVDVDFTTVAWIRSAVFVLVSIPISFAGIGLRELGFISLFGLYGLGANEIMVYAMLALAIQAAIALVGLLLEIRNWLSPS